MKLKFYFDFISPYVWLAWKPLNEITLKYSIKLEPIPILFAGLLNYHGQLGPAEIPSKRNWLIYDVARRAKLQNLTVNPPPTHPFNPLLPLRVATIDYNNHDIKLNLIQNILNATWSEGQDISNPNVLKHILNNLDLNGEQILQEANSHLIKEKLKNETNKAIELGVFGVPTTIVNEKLLFWGSEYETMKMIEMALNGDQTVIVEPHIIEKWANVKKSAERRK